MGTISDVPCEEQSREKVTAIAAFVAWALVSLPGVGQRFGNNNFHTAVPPNPASGTAHPAAAATAAVPASSSSTVSQSFRDLTMRRLPPQVRNNSSTRPRDRLRWTISSIHAAAGNNAKNLPRSLFVFPRYNSLR